LIGSPENKIDVSCKDSPISSLKDCKLYIVDLFYIVHDRRLWWV